MVRQAPQPRGGDLTHRAEARLSAAGGVVRWGVARSQSRQGRQGAPPLLLPPPPQALGGSWRWRGLKGRAEEVRCKSRRERERREEEAVTLPQTYHIHGRKVTPGTAQNVLLAERGLWRTWRRWRAAAARAARPSKLWIQQARRRLCRPPPSKRHRQGTAAAGRVHARQRSIATALDAIKDVFLARGHALAAVEGQRTVGARPPASHLPVLSRLVAAGC